MRGIEMSPFAQALGWTLVHFLWQGTMVAFLAAVAKFALKRCTANLRYFASCTAMLVMLCLPAATFIALYSGTPSTNDVRMAAPGRVAGTDSLKGERGNEAVAGVMFNVPPAPRDLREVFSVFAPWLTMLWLAGVTVLSVRMLGGWYCTRRGKSNGIGQLSELWQQRCAELCREVCVSRPVQILESALVQVPTVIGWIRPVVLIPMSALTGLRPKQLEAIIAHELAHIRRHDYLVNLVQTAVEILLFYHPAVWWISREIRQEREHCCDDVAVRVCGDALVYARALTEIEAQRGVAPQLAMTAGGGSLFRRIQRIVGSPRQSSEQTPSWMAVAMVFALVFSFAVAAKVLPAVSRPAGSSAVGVAPSQPSSRRTPTLKKNGTPALVAEPGQHNAKSETIPENERPTAGIPSEPEQNDGGGSSFIDEMGALGYSNLSVDDLIALKDHAVTPQFVRELKAQGFDKLSVKELIRLKATGVSTQFVKELKEAGLWPLPIESFIRLRAHGVSSALIRDLGEVGYKDLSADQLIRVADHSVTRQFILGLQSAGYRNLAMDEILRARDHGISPEFIQSIRDEGYSSLGIDQVIHLRDRGVDSEFIRKLRSAGYSNATLDQLLRAKDHGISPEYIEGIRNAGYDNVPLEQIIRMRDHSVDAEFIGRAKSRGFQKLSVDQLIRLRDTGVLDR